MLSCTVTELFFFLIFSCFWQQEKNLMEEIARLNNEIHGRDENIKSRRTNITTLESQTAMLRKGSNDYKVKRDELQDERKFVYLVYLFFMCINVFFFWMKKSH
jgi:hypothetical protein